MPGDTSRGPLKAVTTYKQELLWPPAPRMDKVLLITGGSRGIGAATRARGRARVFGLCELVPMKRGGSPGEVDAAILWLLSEEASYTTGALIDVAGGK